MTNMGHPKAWNSPLLKGKAQATQPGFLLAWTQKLPGGCAFRSRAGGGSRVSWKWKMSSGTCSLLFDPSKEDKNTQTRGKSHPRLPEKQSEALLRARIRLVAPSCGSRTHSPPPHSGTPPRPRGAPPFRRSAGAEVLWPQQSGCVFFFSTGRRTYPPEQKPRYLKVCQTSCRGEGTKVHPPQNVLLGFRMPTQDCHCHCHCPRQTHSKAAVW